MALNELALRFDPDIVVLSYVTAVFASYVALDLAPRVRSSDRAVARAWWVAGSISMGTGIWAMHFVGMQALQLPFAVGYAGETTLISWMAAVLVSMIALRAAAQEKLSVPTLLFGALSMGAGICAMHYIGMAALELSPPIRWRWGLVLASVGIAVAASAAALTIFFWLRRLTAGQARWAQWGAALVMGAAIVGMHYTGMAAAGIDAQSVCLSSEGLRGDNLSTLIAAATGGLLLLTLLTSAIDARARRVAARLQQSLQAATQELQQQALRDRLTGLANRDLLDDRLRHAVARARQDGGRVALLLVNLDGFKPINDSFGHAVGDRLLKAAARRLEALTDAHGTVARLGADEFVLLLENDATNVELAQSAQRLLDALAQPFDDVLGTGHQPLTLSASMGIAVFPSEGGDEQLLAQADSAAQSIKRGGGNGFAFFEAHMQADVRDQVELAHDLRAALAAGGAGLALHYQPKVDARTEEVCGVEALLRWKHPQRGPVGPAVFVAVAERFGLITPLGDWVISEACRQLAAWRHQGLQLRVAINLSVQQLRQPDQLIQRLREGLENNGLDAARLTCEITETAAMDDAAATEATLRRLSQLGVTLSIDDFGTGYSSLAYLRRLPVSQLKVDRSFVQDLESSADARSIVKAVIELAHALGLRVVAEGVETTGQANVLRNKGCDEFQGYLFARPMTAQALSEWAGGLADNALSFRPSNYIDL